ncbi:hypothetical protein BTJ40_05115 [Microbulbifer sp. A4B17]|uniref:hypothetical protein n=1 Tax=Microbulbifer sp. A4B17 TaxID=359370 RepID=UPI000D52DCA8|nr:hypothetical protein [Microbulbifer sp. A4B17]AWF80239.1 hypothetical protein BTJ40_05115 [Microbulbifer sp. A4B17]
MSGKKNKHKHRGQQRKQPSEFLDELNSLHNLLVTDENNEEIPVLSQVAKQGNPVTPEPPTLPTIADIPKPSGTPATSEFEDIDTSLEDIDLPILFSPVEEEMLAQQSLSLAESDLALLRPLQELAVEDEEPQASAETGQIEEKPAEDKPVETPLEQNSRETKAEVFPEAQPEREPEPQPEPQAENPFLPNHIRSRLTGGRPLPVEENTQVTEAPVPPEAEAPTTVAPAPEVKKEAELPSTEAQAAEEDPAADPEPSAKERQRQELIEQLVAQQIAKLEPRLRARIEQVVDELGVWD